MGDPGLDKLLDCVWKTDSGFTLCMDGDGIPYLKRAREEIREDVRKRPEHYLAIPAAEAPADGLWGALQDAANEVHGWDFDTVQREFFPAYLCKTGEGFGVYESPRGEVIRVQKSLRTTVQTLRDAGIPVQWEQEEMINRYAHAYCKIGTMIRFTANKHASENWRPSNPDAQ